MSGVIDRLPACSVVEATDEIFPWEDVTAARCNGALQRQHRKKAAKEAYAPSAVPCPGCGTPALKQAWLYFESSEWMWQHLCGRAGWMHRLTSLTYPNGQTSSSSYFGNSGDRRLQTIHHRTSARVTLSKYDYTYSAGGDILTWRQQSGLDAVQWQYAYDPADQLTRAVKSSTASPSSVLKRYAYAYDAAGNRTVEQIDDAVTGASHNSLNRLASQQPNGVIQWPAPSARLRPWRFRGSRRGSPRRSVRKRTAHARRRGGGRSPCTALCERRERRRLEIIAMVEEAQASLARGEGREITEEFMKALAEETKQRLRSRLAAERRSTSD